MSLRKLVLAVPLVLPCIVEAESILGVWETQDRDGHVSMEECSGNTLSGRLVLYAKSHVTGPHDCKNKGPSAGPLLGVLILNGTPRGVQNGPGG